MLYFCLAGEMFVMKPNPHFELLGDGPLGGDDVMEVSPSKWDHCPYKRAPPEFLSPSTT